MENITSKQLRERDKHIEETHRKALAEKDLRYNKLKAYVDQLKKDEFTKLARAERFAQTLGFQDLDEGFMMVDLAVGDATYRGALETVDKLKDKLADLKHENMDLVSRLQDALERPDNSEHERLQEELTALKARYGELAAQHERAALEYKKGFEKWAAFKRWFFDKEQKRHATQAYKREAIIELMRGEDIPDVGDSSSTAVPSPAKPVDKENATPRSVSGTPSRPRNAKIRPIPLSPMKNTPKVKLEEPESESEIEEIATVLPVKLFDEESHNSPIPSRPKAILGGSAPSRKIRRVSDAEGFTSGQPSLPARGSQTSPRKPRIQDEDDPFSTTPTPGPSTLKTSRSTIDYSKFKGRGRYSTGKEKDAAQDAHNTTINSAFVIDREANNGLEFEYSSVERNKEKRKRLHGADCECCADYYEAVGPLPPRQKAPLWKSPDPTVKRHGDTAGMLTPRRERKKGISRHREEWKRGRTPPAYWDIGFPDTQEVARINAQARELREAKWDEVKKDERYMKRR
ncbi:hypothetical protein CYLTODRAFT_383252 [Cylindrobasidium torrendii FP15055 ss-10]|uniref:DNA endonuclease activator Ctp1 C-terminal domain-containing protein n=1 Tax=Cylindrobasidium torrendii FP15055 ss-10 TaxID=1314674 RepID=A0A0D7AXP6_9AGAR|nr:hypothetical protein CYLTODRAFT_383252 [Cylindrobasidium torrendii FP15055 ss-10]